MATGDARNMAARIRAVLPTAWFPVTFDGTASASPTLDALIFGLGAAWAKIWHLLAYARLQTRILTATDFFLDLIAADFFGLPGSPVGGLLRKVNEDDPTYRARIEDALFAPKNTRAALADALTHLTGRAPIIFEPRRTHDTGGHGSLSNPAAGGGFGYAAGPTLQWIVNEPGDGAPPSGLGANGRGCLALPFQFFVTAFRPRANGVANVGGHASLAQPAAGGGYGYATVASPAAGGGLMVHTSLFQSAAQIADAEILDVIVRTIPAGTIAWVHIES